MMSRQKRIDSGGEAITSLGVRLDKIPFAGPSFSLKNRAMRLFWQVARFFLFRYSPRPLHRWRLLVLRAFGADVAGTAFVYPDTIIWAPWNLVLSDRATLGPGVNCYNVAPVSIGERAVVSQGTYLCTASHDYNDPAFQLVAGSIRIEARAWVAANCFVGPGIRVGRGAVLGACTVQFRDTPDWTIWVGNPAIMKGARLPSDTEHVH